MTQFNRPSRAAIAVGIGAFLIWAWARPQLAEDAVRAQRPFKTERAANGLAVPPVPTLSSDFPHLVPQPPDGLTPEQERPWFDTFSWQEFIALNWQATDGQRGVAKNPNDRAAFKAAFAPNAAGDYPQVVWGSWKQAYELFEQGSVRPTPWSSFDSILPCSNPLPTTPKTFLDATPLDINQSFSFPLIDQSQNYTRYEIRINEPEYSLIRGQDNQPTSWLYLTSNMVQASPITFPMSTDTVQGSVEIKAAWKLMTPNDDVKRYYVVNALTLINPATKQSQYQKMGLVGFHIAHKTSPFTEWVWLTFEHNDNIVASPGIKPSYNNGTPQPATPNGFDHKPPLYSGSFTTPVVSVQVTRVNAIATTPAMFSTSDLNRTFQNLLQGTVWHNYQLVATQWPTMPSQFKLPGISSSAGKYPGDCGVPFPTTGVANAVIETYDQGPTTRPTGNSCMSCHYQTATTDFSWVLADRNHAVVPPESQNRFLAVDRFAPNRALNAIEQLGPGTAAKQALLTRPLKLLNARQAEAQ